MKSFFVLFALFVLNACNQVEKNSVTNETGNIVSVAEEDEVAAAVESLNKAIVDPEESLLESLTADELTYGHSSGLVQNKAEFVDDLVNGDFDFSSVDISAQSIYVAGKTAVVRHIFSAEATNAGAPVEVRIGNLLVYQKQAGKWKLLARQSFKL